MYESKVRKVSWELQNSPVEHTVGMPSANYVEKSQLGAIYTSGADEYKALEGGGTAILKISLFT